jgi:ribosomal 30S subunit maturation factor RimM
MESEGQTSSWVCGTLGKVHGLRGELYLNLAPEGLTYLEGGRAFAVVDENEGVPRPCVVSREGGSDARPLVRVDLAATREEAVALQGLTLLASGGALDDLPHYRAGDLLGRVVHEEESGAELGEVVDVLAAPAHDILELRPPTEGKPLLVPLVGELVWEDGRGGLTVRRGLLEQPGGSDGPQPGQTAEERG